MDRARQRDAWLDAALAGVRRDPDAPGAPMSRQERRHAARRRAKDIALVEKATGRELSPDLSDGFATVARHVRDKQSRRGLDATLFAKNQPVAAERPEKQPVAATACHNPTTNETSSHDEDEASGPIRPD